MLSSISLLKMVSINIKKRHLKFLFLVLVVFGISFAFSALQAEVPDPGHPVSEIQKCGEGEVLEIVNGAWDCVSGRITCADLPGGSCAVDSRIGAVTSANPSDGNWCKRDANGKINCLNVAPVGTGGGSGCSIVDNGDFVTITCGSNSANVYDGQDGVATGGDNLGNHNAVQNLDMNGNKITEVGYPTLDTDAATKKYVDTNGGGVTAGAGLSSVTNSGGVTLVTKAQVVSCNTGQAIQQFNLDSISGSPVCATVTGGSNCGAKGVCNTVYAGNPSSGAILGAVIAQTNVYAGMDVNAEDDIIFKGELLPDGLTCSNGQILKKTGTDNWDCVNMPSGSVDTNCGTSGTCSTVYGNSFRVTTTSPVVKDASSGCSSSNWGEIRRCTKGNLDRACICVESSSNNWRWMDITTQ